VLKKKLDLAVFAKIFCVCLSLQFRETVSAKETGIYGSCRQERAQQEHSSGCG